MSGNFRFGEFELDIGAYALRRSGQRIKLEKIPMEVLILFVQSAGSLVKRKDIQAALWDSDVFVEHDAAMNTAVRKVRLALGDDAEKPRFVETVVGKGYRFIAPLEARGADAQVEGGHSLSFSNYLLTRGKREFVLNSGENLLGRDPGACVCIDHPSVSRRHALLSIHSERAVLEDLKSRNGTFVDGRRIEAPMEIHHGATIGLGPITLTFLALSGSASTLPMDDRVGRPDKPLS